MDDNEILTALANLESSLNEINTAKKQVEETVAAYTGIYHHVDAYAGELEKVSEKVLVIINEVKKNAGGLNDVAEQVLSKLSAESQSLSAEYKSSCVTIVEEFKTKTNNTISDFKGICDKSTVDIEASVIKLQNCTNDLNTVETDIRNATELVLELKNDVCILSKELTGSQNEQDKQLQKLIDDIKNSKKDQDGQAERLLIAQKTNMTLTITILLIVLISAAVLLVR